MTILDNVKGNAMFFFFFFLFIMLLVYISTKLSKDEDNCETIQKMRFTDENSIEEFLNLDDLNDMKYFTGKVTIASTVQDYDYKLKDFYIKTAHNCFCNGYYKNGHVNVCALENCASYGVRALDLQIFSKDKKPIVATSSYSQNEIKESFNEIPLEMAFDLINQTYFVKELFIENGITDVKNNMKKDPLFLILRLHYGSNKDEKVYDETTTKNQINFYNSIKTALDSSFDKDKFTREFTEEKNVAVPNMKMMDTKDKIFVFVILNDEPTYEKVKQSDLNDMVDLYGEDLDNYRFNELNNTDGAYTMNKYKSQNNLSLCLPTWSSHHANYDFTQAFKRGTQFVGMNYQNYDSYLNYYNSFFVEQIADAGTKTSPYIKKPDHMIDVDLKDLYES
jgi:hypothetical protein